MIARHGALAAVLVMAALGSVQAEEPIPASDCEMCHDEVVPAYAAGAHGRAMTTKSEEVFEKSCVACHGPGEAHLDDPSAENIVGQPGPESLVQALLDALEDTPDDPEFRRTALTKTLSEASPTAL